MPVGQRGKCLWLPTISHSAKSPARRATALADRLNIDFALINRKRRKGDLADSPSGNMEILVGTVKDKVRLPPSSSKPAAFMLTSVLTSRWLF